MVPSQDEFDGIKTTLVYPDSPLATDLDNNLWLPDIATYAAHHTTCTHAILSHALGAGTTRLSSAHLPSNPAPHGFARTGACTTRRPAFSTSLAGIPSAVECTPLRRAASHRRLSPTHHEPTHPTSSLSEPQP